MFGIVRQIAACLRRRNISNELKNEKPETGAGRRGVEGFFFCTKNPIRHVPFFRRSLMGIFAISAKNNSAWENHPSGKGADL